MNFFPRRKISVFCAAVSAFAIAPLAHADDVAAPLEKTPVEIAAQKAAQSENAPTAPEMTVLADTENGGDATILNGAEVAVAPAAKNENKRAQALARRRQSEERLLDMLREVGGDVPLLRESLRDFLSAEARARRPMRDASSLLLAALNIGVTSEKTTTTNATMEKMRGALGLETPQNSASKTPPFDAEVRVSLSQQKTAASAPKATENDARVLAAQSDEELRALVARMRQMQAAERERRAAREAELDSKLHFRDNPRLEAALLLLGIIGDSGYTVSLKILPPARIEKPISTVASTREVEEIKQNEK